MDIYTKLVEDERELAAHLRDGGDTMQDYKIYLYEEYEDEGEQAPLMAVVQAASGSEAQAIASKALDWAEVMLMWVALSQDENGEQLAHEAQVAYIK